MTSFRPLVVVASLSLTHHSLGGGPSPAPGLRLPARHGGVRKSLENEGVFDEIRPCFCKSLEINKTNSVLRVLYGVMSLCSLCNSRDFTPPGVHHHPAASPAFPVSRPSWGGSPVVPDPRRGVGTRDNLPFVSEISFFQTDKTAS